VLKQKATGIQTKSDFYEQNPQYKIPGAIIQAIGKGELAIEGSALLTEVKKIQKLVEILHPSLMPIKETLSTLLEKASEISVDADSSSAAEVELFSDNNAIKVDSLGDSYNFDDHGWS